MNVANARGDVLMRMIIGPEGELVRPGLHCPMTHALVAARHREQYLFIFNRVRRNWEVPGGRIEPGESARACAERELLEESGQVASALTFAGVMEFSKYPDGHFEYGALYFVELDSVTEVESTDEAESVMLWDLESHIGEVDEIDRALCRWLGVSGTSG